MVFVGSVFIISYNFSPVHCLEVQLSHIVSFFLLGHIQDVFKMFLEFTRTIILVSFVISSPLLFFIIWVRAFKLSSMSYNRHLIQCYFMQLCLRKNVIKIIEKCSQFWKFYLKNYTRMGLYRTAIRKDISWDSKITHTLYKYTL